MKIKSLLLALWMVMAGCGDQRPSALSSETAAAEMRKQIHLSGAAQLKAGAAKVEITPPVGTPLAGYGKRKGKPSTGIRDPLYVRALALDDGEDKVLILSADLLIFPQPLAEEILRKISEEEKIPREAIVLAATHTHSGPGAIAHGFLYEKIFGRYRPQIVEGIKGRVLWAAHQALENRKPARWESAVSGGLEDFAENRAADGGPVDPDLSVLVLEGGDGSIQAALVNWAAHPTLLDSGDGRFSGDFPGEVCRQMESSYPGSVCLFVNGAAGDSRPAERVGPDPEERIRRLGSALAEVATGLINQGRPQSHADLASWGGWFRLPPPQVRLGPVPLHPAIGKRMRPASVFLGMVALDDKLLVPLPAEITADLGRELKAKLRDSGFRPLLTGYSNGYLGYAVTGQRYRSGSYESRMTWYGPWFGASLVENLWTLASLYPERRKEE